MTRRWYALAIWDGRVRRLRQRFPMLASTSRMRIVRSRWPVIVLITRAPTSRRKALVALSQVPDQAG